MRQVGKFWNRWKLVFVFLVLFLALILSVMVHQESIFYLELRGNNGEIKIINPFFDERGYFLFLPSYADEKCVDIVSRPFASVRMDGCSVDKLKISDIGDMVSIGDVNYPLHIYHSENVSTIFVDISSAGIEKVQHDKGEAACNISVYDVEGNLNISNASATLRLRGNSTRFPMKKPYTLEFRDEQKLLGMTSAKKWTMLANAYDKSNIRNYISLDIAEKLGFEYVTDCKFADVYINGLYNGLYLITEKLEVGPEKLDLKDGDMLCESVGFGRGYLGYPDPLWSSGWLGQVFHVIYPQTSTESQMKYFYRLLQESEYNIVDPKHYDSGILDYDSLAKKYLLDEVLIDGDAGMPSSFYYIKTVNGKTKLYGGPVWDFDRVMGGSMYSDNPECFYANKGWRRRGKWSAWYEFLYKNNEFYSSVINIYKSQMLNILNYELEVNIPHIADKISTASHLNNIRWEKFFTDDAGFGVDSGNLMIISDFLRKRIAFLNKIWIEGETYITLQMEVAPDKNFIHYSVREGESFSIPQEDWNRYGWNKDTKWVNWNTGEAFVDGAIIKEDVIYVMSME